MNFECSNKIRIQNSPLFFNFIFAWRYFCPGTPSFLNTNTNEYETLGISWSKNSFIDKSDGKNIDIFRDRFNVVLPALDDVFLLQPP